MRTVGEVQRVGESGKCDKERMEHGEAQWEDELCGAAAQTDKAAHCLQTPRHKPRNRAPSSMSPFQ